MGTMNGGLGLKNEKCVRELNLTLKLFRVVWDSPLSQITVKPLWRKYRTRICHDNELNDISYKYKTQDIMQITHCNHCIA